MGLGMIRRLIERMGGHIGAASTVGAGSVFWIKPGTNSALPLVFHEDEAGALARPVVPDGSPILIMLYVEDNPAKSERVESLIVRRSDLRLLTAADGNIGIEFARAYQPKLILMDINLPGISGIEAMKILHGDPATAHIPIIALSANAAQRDIKRGLEGAFIRFITKPMKVAAFMAALHAALAASRSATTEST